MWNCLYYFERNLLLLEMFSFGFDDKLIHLYLQTQNATTDPLSLSTQLSIPCTRNYQKRRSSVSFHVPQNVTKTGIPESLSRENLVRY